MDINGTIDCTLEQWEVEIKDRISRGELVLWFRSRDGGIYRLGTLPDDPEAEKLQVISF